ncbi:MAG: hypothetical protein IJ017_07240 [Oscillospiraceae bacterium]|nr:hypothetical protein [Oscillospiraceae bacterium]
MDISKFASSDKIRGKERELTKLANSHDGEKIKQMVDGDALQKALDTGDTAALQSTISQVLKTDEGARLLSQLEQLFK